MAVQYMYVCTFHTSVCMYRNMHKHYVYLCVPRIFIKHKIMHSNFMIIRTLWMNLGGVLKYKKCMYSSYL